MKSLLILSIMVAVMVFFGASRKYPPLETFEKVDLEKYMGKWYEIAAFPQRFEKGCHCSAAEYELTAKNYVRVTNSCRRNSPSGKLTVARGKGFVVKGSNNAKLKIQFFWPFKGNYWIIDLAPDYSYAVVGDPSRKYLWILSRTPQMDMNIYQEILKRAEAKGFDITRLKMMDQSCP